VVEAPPPPPVEQVPNTSVPAPPLAEHRIYFRSDQIYGFVYEYDSALSSGARYCKVVAGDSFVVTTPVEVWPKNDIKRVF
jgi:hypothetical protein